MKPLKNIQHYEALIYLDQSIQPDLDERKCVWTVTCSTLHKIHIRHKIMKTEDEKKFNERIKVMMREMDSFHTAKQDEFILTP